VKRPVEHPAQSTWFQKRPITIPGFLAFPAGDTAHHAREFQVQVAGYPL